jgi:hypothetical protein
VFYRIKCGPFAVPASRVAAKNEYWLLRYAVIPITPGDSANNIAVTGYCFTARAGERLSIKGVPNQMQQVRLGTDPASK